MTSRVCAVCGSSVVATAQAWLRPKIIDPPVASAVTVMPLARRKCRRGNALPCMLFLPWAHGPFYGLAPSIQRLRLHDHKLIQRGRQSFGKNRRVLRQRVIWVLCVGFLDGNQYRFITDSVDAHTDARITAVMKAALSVVEEIQALRAVA